MSITVDTILSILNKTIDILLVWLMFYYILKNMKNNVKLTLIFKGVLIVAFLKIISDFFKYISTKEKKYKTNYNYAWYIVIGTIPCALLGLFVVVPQATILNTNVTTNTRLTNLFFIKINILS